MPTITTRQITGQPPGRVWNALLDTESLPSYVPQLAEAEILDQQPGRRTTSWAILLDGPRLEWVQDEVIDHERRRIDFRFTEGPLSRCAGHWRADTEGRHTTVELHVDFDLGIPLMDGMLGPIAAQKLRLFTESALAGFASRRSR